MDHRHRSSTLNALLAGAATCLLGCASVPTAVAEPSATVGLPKFEIDPASITVSGLSSGAFMAVQLHLAHSSVVSGVATVAGGPWFCAKGDAARADRICMKEPSSVDVSELVKMATEEARANSIDPLSTLARSRVFVMSGRRDVRVKPQASEKLIEFYGTWVPGKAILYDDRLEAGHGLPTVDFGADCVRAGAPHLLKCGYDAAEKILSHLYGPLRPAGEPKDGSLLAFSQEDFGSKDALLGKSGAVYVPETCRAGKKCRLHVALHGCQQSGEFIRDQYDRYSGFNRWAESNDIVVLYPKTTVSNRNPFACWDWFGYSGPDYATKAGKQIQVIKAMIDRVAGR